MKGEHSECEGGVYTCTYIAFAAGPAAAAVVLCHFSCSSVSGLYSLSVSIDASRIPLSPSLHNIVVSSAAWSMQATPHSSSLASAPVIIGQPFNITYFPTDSHRNSLSCAHAPHPSSLMPSIVIVPPTSLSESGEDWSSSSTSSSSSAALPHSTDDGGSIYITPLHVSQCTEIPFSNASNTVPVSFASGSFYVASFAIKRHVKPLSSLRLQLNNITIHSLKPNWR